LVYVTLDAFKASRSMTGFDYADADATQALSTASRVVDVLCDRRFYPYDPSNDQTRYYTPIRPVSLEIDDLIGLTSLQTDQDGDGVFETTWVVGTDFELAPDNAALDGRPYERIVLKQRSRTQFPVGVPKSVEVVGSFGWSTVPQQVVTLTTILAARFLERTRTSPLGVVGLGVAGAVYIAKQDPDVMTLVRDFDRSPIFVG
jgi:hypothetical protein